MPGDYRMCEHTDETKYKAGNGEQSKEVDGAI